MIIEKLTKTLEERENNYNHPLPSFSGIVDLWNSYLHSKYNTTIMLTPMDVSQMMILMKVSRFSQNPEIDNIDCLMDIAGYAVCAEKILESEQEETFQSHYYDPEDEEEYIIGRFSDVGGKVDWGAVEIEKMLEEEALKGKIK